MNGPFSPCGQWFGSLHGQFWAFKARWPSTANRHNWKDDHQNENRFENHTYCRSEKSCHHPSCSGLSKKLTYLIIFFDITNFSEPLGTIFGSESAIFEDYSLFHVWGTSLKSVHFKKAVAQSSFLSKLW